MVMLSKCAHVILQYINSQGRKKYCKHGLKAKANTEKYLSLIIDGMDQGKHNLPHLATNTKVKFVCLIKQLTAIYRSRGEKWWMPSITRGQ